MNVVVFKQLGFSSEYIFLILSSVSRTNSVNNFTVLVALS